MGKGGFKELRVWQRAKDLAVFIYKVTDSGPFKRDYGLKDQIRRAAVSIPSNIAEGDERDTDKDAVRFYTLPRGPLLKSEPRPRLLTRSGTYRKMFLTRLTLNALH